MQSNRKKNSRSGNKRSARRRDGGGVDAVPLVSADSPGKFKTLSLVFPPRMCMKMKYWTIGAFSLAAALGANYRYRPSAAFDVDPALGGTSMAGFAEMAAQYATYRVIGSKIKVTLPNPSATVPVTLIVLPMNADPTNAFSLANIVASVGQPYSKTKQCGLLGCNSAVIVSEMRTRIIWGDPAVFSDHNFSSLVTTVPANNWFWNICVYAPAFIATGLNATVEIEVDVEFFDRVFLPA